MDKINYCMGKIIFALANSFSHGQNNVCMGNFIIAFANLLLHGQIYYCIGKSIIACMGKFIEHWQSILYGQNYFAYATKDSFQNSVCPFSCA